MEIAGQVYSPQSLGLRPYRGLVLPAIDVCRRAIPPSPPTHPAHCPLLVIVWSHSNLTTSYTAVFIHYCSWRGCMSSLFVSAGGLLHSSPISSTILSTLLHVSGQTARINTPVSSFDVLSTWNQFVLIALVSAGLATSRDFQFWKCNISTTPGRPEEVYQRMVETLHRVV